MRLLLLKKNEATIYKTDNINSLSYLSIAFGHCIFRRPKDTKKESEGQTVWWEEFAGYSSLPFPHQQADGEDGQDDVCKKADHIIL